MKCLRASVLAALLSLALGAATAHAVVVPVTVGTSVAHAVFAEPLPGNADNQIHNHLLSLIQNTPERQNPPAQIRAAIHSITNTQIADALVDKSKNGVDVQVVYPADPKKRFDAASRLAASGSQVQVQWCDHGGAFGSYAFGCISTYNGVEGDPGTMHAKYMLFSKTDIGGLRNWVTWFGSANLTQDTGTETWNDGLTVFDNKALYDAFDVKLFRPMFADNLNLAGNDFYDPASGRGYFSVPSAGLTLHASPDAAPGDVVDAKLEAMDARSAGCSVLVMMSEFTRTVVADQLATMKRAGCQVLVLVGMDGSSSPPNVLACPTGAPHIRSDVLGTLKSAGISVRAKKIHDKVMLLHAANYGWRVITGSHNLTNDALRENDEILVDVDSQSAYDAFAAHWSQGWSNSCAV